MYILAIRASIRLIQVKNNLSRISYDAHINTHFFSNPHFRLEPHLTPMATTPEPAYAYACLSLLGPHSIWESILLQTGTLPTIPATTNSTSHQPSTSNMPPW